MPWGDRQLTHPGGRGGRIRPVPEKTSKQFHRLLVKLAYRPYRHTLSSFVKQSSGLFLVEILQQDGYLPLLRLE